MNRTFHSTLHSSNNHNSETNPVDVLPHLIPTEDFPTHENQSNNLNEEESLLLMQSHIIDEPASTKTSKPSSLSTSLSSSSLSSLSSSSAPSLSSGSMSHSSNEQHKKKHLEKNYHTEANPVDVLPHLINVKESALDDHEAHKGNLIDKESFLLMQSQIIMGKSEAPSSVSVCSSSSASSASGSTKKSPAVAITATYLDEETAIGKDYTPGNWDVICGRGKASYDHVGNRRLRVTVAYHLQQYVNVTSTLEKINISKGIIDQIRENARSIGGFGFVAKDASGKWCEVGNLRAREKVGHAFRDFMKGALLRRNNDQYSSQEIETQIKESQDQIFQACRLMKKPPKKRRSSATSSTTSSSKKQMISYHKEDSIKLNLESTTKKPPKRRRSSSSTTSSKKQLMQHLKDCIKLNMENMETSTPTTTMTAATSTPDAATATATTASTTASATASTTAATTAATVAAMDDSRD